MDNSYQSPILSQFEEPDPDKKAICLDTEDLHYMQKIEDLQNYLDKVKNMVKPGCSQEVLRFALSSMSSLVSFLSISTRPKLHASLWQVFSLFGRLRGWGLVMIILYVVFEYPDVM